MSMITLGLIVLTVSLFYYYCIKPMSYWNDKGIKQGRSVWLFGDVGIVKTTFRRISVAGFYEELYKRFPQERYFGYYQYLKPTLLIRDPELIKQLTVKDFDHFVDHRQLLSEEADPLWANNLVALTGEKWRDMRSLLSPFFTSSKMKNMFILMSNCAHKFADYFLEKNQDIVEVEFKDIFTRYCNDVIATTAFGVETDSLREQDNDFYLMGREATSFTSLKKGLKFLLMLVAPKLAEFFKIQLFSPEVKHFFYELVDETIRFREQKDIVRPDMIHLLMQGRKGSMKPEKEGDDGTVETGFSTAQEYITGKSTRVKLTNKQIASQAMIFFFGGFDSVSTLMCFIAYELAANPDIQQKLRDEVEATFEDCNGELTYDGLNKMKYMDMVVSETLRKWPVNVAADRECTKPYTLKPVSPEEIPLNLVKGDLIIYPIYSIHHDDKYYPDPEKFDPERFSDENNRNINPLAYLPFGSGPRNCIGSRFALLESKAVIFHVLHHFEIVPTKKSKIPVTIAKGSPLLLPKEGFWFGLRRLI